MQVRALKYLLPFVFFATAIQSFHSHGWTVWIPMIIAWIIIPLLELLLPPDPVNMDEAQRKVLNQHQ